MGGESEAEIKISLSGSVAYANVEKRVFQRKPGSVLGLEGDAGNDCQSARPPCPDSSRSFPKRCGQGPSGRRTLDT